MASSAVRSKLRLAKEVWEEEAVKVGIGERPRPFPSLAEWGAEPPSDSSGSLLGVSPFH